MTITCLPCSRICLNMVSSSCSFAELPSSANRYSASAAAAAAAPEEPGGGGTAGGSGRSGSNSASMKGCWQIRLRSLQIRRSCAPRVPAILPTTFQHTAGESFQHTAQQASKHNEGGGGLVASGYFHCWAVFCIPGDLAMTGSAQANHGSTK
jgi:hypothetical protein